MSESRKAFTGPAATSITGVKNSAQVISAFGMALVLAGSLSAQEHGKPRAIFLEPGTTFPIVVLNTVTAKRSHGGDVVHARTVQPVALGGGEVLPRWTEIRGRILRAESNPEPRSGATHESPSVLELVFDVIHKDGTEVPAHLAVRAVADPIEAQSAGRPDGDADLDPTRTMVLIGGDRLTPAQRDVEDREGKVVGRQKNLAVFARLIASKDCDATSREVSLGVFSPSACGAYGFNDVVVQGIGFTTADGRLTLTSSRHTPTLWRNSAVLLEVMPRASEIHSRR